MCGMSVRMMLTLGDDSVVYTVKEGRRIFCIQCPRPDVVFMQYNIIRLRIRHIDISSTSVLVYRIIRIV